MTKHKWYNEIVAWAGGAEIEKWMLNDTWQIELRPDWYDYEKYRIKPQPVEPQYLYAYRNSCDDYVFSDLKVDKIRTYKYIGKIPLIVESNDD